MSKSRIHTVILTLEFDKPCTAEKALAIVKDCIWGKFYPTESPSDPEVMEIKDYRLPGEAPVTRNRRTVPL